jgi:hypothetical protein
VYQQVQGYACINVAVKFGDRIEYPDLMVMIGHGRHKQCEPDHENNYFVGPANFILEIHQDFRSKAVKERKKLFSSFEVQNTSLLMTVRQSSNGFGWSMAILNYFIQTEME